MKRQQQGFTLIELVIVIVILGILSAFALPRFADLGGDARAAAVEGAAGAIKSASSIVHSACLADANCDENADADAANVITLEGEDIELRFGYPTAGAAGIQAAAQLEDADFNITRDGGDPETMTVEATGAPGTCQVTYQESGSADNSPTITTDVDGDPGC